MAGEEEVNHAAEKHIVESVDPYHPLATLRYSEV